MWAALERELDWRRAAPKGGGTGLPSKQRRGPSPKTRLGGPQGSLGRTSLSGPFGPWPQGGSPSRGRRHLGGGRGRGLRAPGKGAGKIPHNTRQAPGPERARVRRARGSQATGDPGAGQPRRLRAGPSARAKVGGLGGRRDPLSLRPAFPGLCTVRDPFCPVRMGRGRAPPWSALPLVSDTTRRPGRAQPGPRTSALRHPRRPGRPRGSDQPSPAVFSERECSQSSGHDPKGPESAGPGGRAAPAAGTPFFARPGRERARLGAWPGWVRRPGRGLERRPAEERRGDQRRRGEEARRGEGGEGRPAGRAGPGR